MAGRKKKTGEFLREQQAKELARLEELGVGAETGLNRSARAGGCAAGETASFLSEV